MRRWLLAGCLSAVLAGAAAAQPAPEAPQPAPDAPPQPPPRPQPPLREARDDAGWRLYHDAFDAMLRGKREEAIELTARLRREHAEHPAVALVEGSSLAVDAPRARDRREEPTSGATAELALFQTLHGLALGIEICVVAGCEDSTIFGLSLAGGASGAITSLKVVGPVTSGQRALLNNGTLWGAFNAFMALIAIDPRDEESAALAMIGGQSAGLGVGALLYRLRPTAGQVALASSGGHWGAALMMLALHAANGDTSGKQLAVTAMLAADVGLGMGAYLAKIRPNISRAQTLVIDAGGIVGGVGGGGIGVLLSGGFGEQTTAAAAAIGAALGLGAAAYFTRHWDEPDGGGDRGGASAVLMPVEHGRGGLVGLAGTW